ncbi:hypothetical protein K4Q22_10750 [Staphylococcus epidermidis]|nr:hypothetical protein [Staphylococcus epidermidis]
MKKVINILLIAILSIIFIGLTLFVVNFAKDMFISDNKKSDTVSKKQDKVKKEAPAEENENGDNPNSRNNTIAQPNTNTNVTTNDVRTNESGEVIHKTKNGIDYVGKFDSPQEEAQYERDVMSQTGGGATPQNNKSDYEKQLEMYDKAARGEVEEPGAHVH